MKNFIKITLFAALLLTTFSISAQEVSTNTSSSVGVHLNNLPFSTLGTKGDLPNKYRAIVLGFGTRGISSTPGTIITSFVDDSPSADSFQSTEEIDDYQSRAGVQFGFHFGKFQGLSHSIFFDIAFGEAQGVALGYSLGYNFSVPAGNKYLHIRPNVTGLLGNTRILLGKIQNNAGYIQIGTTEFYDSELNVKLNGSTFLLRPGCDFMYDLTENISLFANASYDFGSQSGEPDLYFESLASAGDNQQTASKPLDSPSVNVTYNGDEVTELPFELGGLRFTIGAAFVWTKD